MDKLRAMEAFVRIVDRGSLTAAAEALQSSLPAVVRLLAALEVELGVRLLNRTTRRIALTDEGREYYERCRRVLDDVAEADAAMSARRITPRGRLVVTAPVAFGRMHVAPIVAAFLLEHRGLSIDLRLADRIVDLVEEGIDAAVRIGRLADSSVVAVPVGATRRVVCASPAYLQRAGIPRTVADLARHRVVSFTGLASGDEWTLAIEGAERRVAVAPVFVTNQIDAALDACVRGAGLGQFLSYQAEPHLRTRKLRRVLETLEPKPVPIQVVHTGVRLLPLRVRAFVDFAVPRLRAIAGAARPPGSADRGP